MSDMFSGDGTDDYGNQIYDVGNEIIKFPSEKEVNRRLEIIFKEMNNGNKRRNVKCCESKV